MKTEKPSWSVSAFEYVKTSTLEIAYGVGDALWGAATMPEKAFKYWTGVDKHLGQNRPWSFRNLGQYLDRSLTGNPLFRVGDTAAHLFYGAINTLTGAIPNQVFNQWLGMNIEYFAPPPKNLREQSAWVAGGVMVALPLRNPVLKAMGAEAKPSLSYGSNSSSANASAVPETGPNASAKITFVDMTRQGSNPEMIFVDKSLGADSGRPIYFTRPTGSSGSGGGGMRMVEAGSESVLLQVPETSHFLEVGTATEIRFETQNSPVFRVSKTPFEEMPQEFPNGQGAQPMVEPSGMFPDFYLVPGLDKTPETIGDPKESTAAIQDPVPEGRNETQILSPAERGAAALRRERIVAENLRKLFDFSKQVHEQGMERAHVSSMAELYLPFPFEDLIHLAVTFDGQGQIDNIVQRETPYFDTHVRGDLTILGLTVFNDGPPGAIHPVLIDMVERELFFSPQGTRVLERMWEQSAAERERVLQKEPFLLDGVNDRGNPDKVNYQTLLEDLRAVIFEKNRPYQRVNVRIFIDENFQPRAGLVSGTARSGDFELKITRPSIGEAKLQIEYQEISPTVGMRENPLPDRIKSMIPVAMAYLQAKAEKSMFASLSPVESSAPSSQEILENNRKKLAQAIKEHLRESMHWAQFAPGIPEHYLGTMILLPYPSEVIPLRLNLSSSGEIQEILNDRSDGTIHGEGLEVLAHRGGAHVLRFDPNFIFASEAQRVAMTHLFNSYEDARYQAFLENPVGLDFFDDASRFSGREILFDKLIYDLREIAFESRSPYQEIRVYFYTDELGTPRARALHDRNEMPDNAWGSVLLKIAGRSIPELRITEANEKVIAFEGLRLSFLGSFAQEIQVTQGILNALNFIRDLSNQDLERKKNIAQGRIPRTRRDKPDTTSNPPFERPTPRSSGGVPQLAPRPSVEAPTSVQNIPQSQGVDPVGDSTAEVGVDVIARMLFPQLGSARQPGIWRRIFGGGRPNWTDSPHLEWKSEEKIFHYKMPPGLSEVVFGRAGDEVVKGDERVSRRHFKITRMSDPQLGTGYVLTSLDGITFVNGEPLGLNEKKWIRTGDKIQIAPEVVFVFKP